MLKQTGLCGIEDRNLSGTFITFYISVLMWREREREKGNEANWLPKIKDVANNICSPFQRQGAYTHIGYSL